MHEPGAPRVLFMAKPPAAVLAELEAALPIEERDALGARLFAPDNWHQSLSSVKYTSDPAIIEMMRRTGARISATAVTMVFRFLVGTREHLRLQPRGIPEGFRALLDAVESALDEQFRSSARKTPHITVSFRSPLGMLRRPIRPVSWTLDEVLLVEGGGHPYHYEVLDRWPLTPRTEPQLLLPF